MDLLFSLLETLLKTLLETPRGILALLLGGFFLIVTFARRDQLYWFLDYSLENGPRIVRVVGDLVGLLDSLVKAQGINFVLLGMAGVSVLPTPEASVVFLAIFVFMSRYWVYPEAFKAVVTKSLLDDSILILDVSVRSLGVYQIILQGIPFLPGL